MAKLPNALKWDGVPRAMIDLARRRTAFLRGYPCEVLPLDKLLANAYLQGIADASETVGHAPHVAGCDCKEG